MSEIKAGVRNMVDYGTGIASRKKKNISAKRVFRHGCHRPWVVSLLFVPLRPKRTFKFFDLLLYAVLCCITQGPTLTGCYLLVTQWEDFNVKL
jgi:hypothetical protein